MSIATRTPIDRPAPKERHMNLRRLLGWLLEHIVFLRCAIRHAISAAWLKEIDGA